MDVRSVSFRHVRVQWSPSGRKLATGSNDNSLAVCDPRMGARPELHIRNAHKAAVRALAWSPHRWSMLASGGGTADMHIT